MKLLYVPPLGGGIKDLHAAGQHRRLLEDYCQSYLTQFDEVLILSFFNEDLKEYADVAVDPRIKLLPNRRGLQRYVYALLAPWIHRKDLHDVAAIRVSQTTGSLPALALKIALRGRPVFMTYGYDYVLFARIRGILAAWLARLHERIGRWAADYWITTTQELADLLRTRHHAQGQQTLLIPNGVDLSRFKPDPASNTGLLKHLVFVGRLEAQKNLFDLLDHLSQTADHLGQDITLDVVGEGSRSGALKTHRTSPRLSVRFQGKVGNNELPALLREADAFVTATLFEGHPKAVLEAMACGLPVLGLDSPGLGLLLRESGQLTFSDQGSFAKAIQRLNDTQVRTELGSKAERFARQNFDLKKTLERETQIIFKVSKEQRA